MMRLDPRSTRRPLVLAAALLLLSPLAACGGGDELPIHHAPAPISPVSSRDASGDAPGGAPATAAPPGVTEGSAGAGASAAGLAWIWPAAWQPRPPSSPMRMAEATIPGDGGAGDLTVFFFGSGGGGGVDANIDRWIGQMEVTPGSVPRRDGFESGGFTVTWVDVEGTLLPSMMGSGPTTPQPGSRLLGAVVEGPSGPWFFKATGPSATLDAAREDFLAMLRGVRRGV